MRRIIGFAAGCALGALAGAVAGLWLASRGPAGLRLAVRERLQMVVDDSRLAAAEKRAELRWRFAEAKQLPPRPTPAVRPWEPPQSLS